MSKQLFCSSPVSHAANLGGGGGGEKKKFLLNVLLISLWVQCYIKANQQHHQCPRWLFRVFAGSGVHRQLVLSVTAKIITLISQTSDNASINDMIQQLQVIVSYKLGSAADCLLIFTNGKKCCFDVVYNIPPDVLVSLRLSTGTERSCVTLLL